MIKAIVAVDSEWGIAKDGKLPWYIPEDLKIFKKLTVGNGNNIVLMGRKTKESLPIFPLPNRINLVLTSTPTKVNEISNLMILNKYTFEDLFIIGGKSMYDNTFSKTLPELIYISRIHKNYDCDMFIDHNIIEKNYEISTTTKFNDFDLETWNIKC